MGLPTTLTSAGGAVIAEKLETLIFHEIQDFVNIACDAFIVSNLNSNLRLAEYALKHQFRLSWVHDLNLLNLERLYLFDTTWDIL